MSNKGSDTKKLFLISIFLFLLAANTALSQDVRYNFDKSTSFSKCKTYKWVPIPGTTQLDNLTDKQIRSALDAELARKGLTKVEGDNADLFIGYQAAIDQEKQFTSFSSGWGYGPGWYGGGWYGYPAGVITGQTSTIYIGQLAIDMYDAANHSLVWRGVVSKTLDPKARPGKRQRNLEKAVARLLKTYPPS